VPASHSAPVPAARWSTAQVLALAPDAGSAKGARSVGGTASWQAVGVHDEVVWGLCKGSGQKPYQVIVDLSGPAYKCSCPSRKFPCKHALGLLMVWAGGAGDVVAPPAWVAEWRESRVKRAAAPRSPSSAPADPAAAAKRAQQRGDRVAGGMAELRRWLDDQVQQGLAGAEQAGHRPFETMAARLVDAQAPGAAGAVRRMGRTVGVGAHWADRLLGELALLRLLVSGYDRLDALPADLAATVRSRVGFPIGTDEVLAGVPVRDRWQVLGQVDIVDEALTARRTWLHGVVTGRFALLLAFAAPGQAFGADVVPGTEIDAELHFYPGAAPLRAALGTRYGSPAPLRSPTGATGVPAALAQVSETLAAEPWRDDVPVLLAGVAPSSDGHLVDAAGHGVPLAAGHREPWWLLAATGGAPGSVAGEWTAAGLRPLATWTADGRYVPAAAGLPDATPRSPELPPELLASALVGTARRPWTGGPLRVGDRAVTVDGTLLEAAAVAVTYRRAATPPAAGHTPVPPAPAETAPPVPVAAGARLVAVLAGAAPGGRSAAEELLAQWLRLAATRGALAPADTLPALLDAGRRSTAIRPDLARVAGRRGAWLAVQRPQWAYLRDEAAGAGSPAPGDPGVWETGTFGERVEHLAGLRRTDPGAARELLAGSFDKGSAEERVRFLEVLADGLSADDDGFLDTVLDDRRKEVRNVALSLLRRLPSSARQPGSSFGQRMAARAVQAVRLERRTFGRDRLIVTPPREVDAGLRRDGVPATPPPGVGAGAFLLTEIVAGTPLATWTDGFGRGPADVIDLARDDDFRAPLLHGWARAAIAQRDAGWAAALVDAAERVRPGRSGTTGGLPPELSWDLHLVLPPAELAGFAARALGDDPARAHRLLSVHPGEWPDDLAVAVIDVIARRARTDQHAWQLAELCRAAALAMPARHATAIGRLALHFDNQALDPARVRPVAELAVMLTFRHEMHQELM
jgi:hypothetical protein